MSGSTCMYYTGLDPVTLNPVHVPRENEKKIQRALLHYRDPANRWLVAEGLAKAGREDLIGRDPRCLVAGGNRNPPPSKKSSRPKE